MDDQIDVNIQLLQLNAITAPDVRLSENPILKWNEPFSTFALGAFYNASDVGRHLNGIRW